MLALHVSVHSFDHPHGAHMPCFVLLVRKSAEPNLVTAQSTAYEPPGDGRMSGPKHVVVTSLKGF
jgi:hypothetical protein